VETTLHAAWEGLQLVFSWPNILYPIAGTLLAMVVAFLPGLSGATLMALAIPFTLSWEPVPVMLTFGGLVGGATFMGSMTAILFNVPGSGPSAATLLDGYPMAQQGRARTAIGCAALSSALGSSIGIFILILLVPLMREAIVWFGPAEMLILTLWGLSTIASIAKGRMVRALIAAGVGLLLAFVGQDARTGEARFTAGLPALQDGLGFIPVVLGLFSVAEMLHLGVSRRATIAGRAGRGALTGSVREGARAVFQHLGLLLRSSTIGTVVGIIPGVGGTMASFMAYGHAVNSARGGGTFGNGDIRGVIAPEAAHDAKDGGALVPVLAFGIPGNESTAVLMAALLLHGLAPGRELLTSGLTLVFVLIWSLFLSNWITSIVGVLCARPLSYLTILRVQVLTPIILTLVVVGAFIADGRLVDVFVALGFGALGYYMKKHDWPRMPLIVALLLGRAFEVNLHVTQRLYELGRLDLFQRPIAMGLLLLTIATILMPLIRRQARSVPS
jgi:putative tricarboxylic transport membrane protein